MVMNPNQGALVEETVLEVIQQGQLTEWREQLIFGKNIRRLDHFSLVTDREYKELGLPPEDVKKLRSTVLQIQRRILNTNTEVKTLYVQNTQGPSVPARNIFITKEQIKLMENLGEGTFAVVKRAIWCREDGSKVDVAVKILRDMSPLVMEDLKVEAGHLLKLKHPNLIQLHGVVQHPAMMVFELCEGGALLDRLRDDKKPLPLLTCLLDYCLQIVKAMSYLEKEHCVHRDLAARNILLTSDEKTVKICDFGLMRNLKENEEMYIMGPQKRVPFSWCPPEALKHRKFSHASDVWAFGVTVWELFSLGEEPWIGCRALDVLKRLDAGERLEKPQYCSQQIYDIVALCWKVNPEHRPKFTQLKGYLQEAQFNLAEVRESQQATEKNLAMTSGDRVIVVNNIGVTWYGQNMRTTRFGSFLRSSVFVMGTASTKPVPAVPPPPTASPSVPVVAATPATRVVPPVSSAPDRGNAMISRPIKDSFIHAGHDDGRGNSWGQPDFIDEIYLKNPVIGIPIDGGIQLSPSTFDRSKAPTPVRPAPPPPSKVENGNKPGGQTVKTSYPDPFRHWNDFEAAQSSSFSPSKIDLPPVPYGALKGLGTTTGREDLTVTSVYHRKEDPSPILPPKKTQQPDPKLLIPNHRVRQLNPPLQPPYTPHSHNVIFPNGTTAGTLPIHQAKPNPPLISSQTQMKQTLPPSSASASNILGNNVTRPPVVTQSIPRPITDNKKDIPIIRPLDYRNTYNGGSKTVLTPAPIQTPTKKYNQMTDKNKNVINELNFKLQPTGGGPSARNVHAAPSSSAHLNSSASDPFVVSPAVKEVVDAKRYNEALEKVQIRPQQQMPNPPTHMVRPHSTIGGPSAAMGPIPCLVPTPIQPVQKFPAPGTTAAVQNVTPSRPVPTVQPPPPSTVMPTKPLTVVIPEKREERSHSSSVGTSSAQVRPPQAQQSQQTQVTRPAGQAKVATIAPTPAGTLPRGPTVDRQSRIDEEIASALPPPSRLFYGTTEETAVSMRPSTSSSTSAPRPHSVTGVPFPSELPSVSQPIPVKPVDPLPLSLNNVLQPIKLHSAPERPPPLPMAPPPERNIDVASIMNAYRTPPMFVNPLNPLPGYYPNQVPLYALGGNLPIAAAPPALPADYNFRNTVTVDDRATFVVGDNQDIVAALDPLANRTGSPATGSSSISDRADQMEVLYKEASFVDPSRCDEMVKKCDGDIGTALKELKMDYLVDTDIAPDKGRAWSALESTRWDLNQAAETLLGG